MATTTTLTEVRLRNPKEGVDDAIHTGDNYIDKASHTSPEEIFRNSASTTHSSHPPTTSQPFSCFMKPNEKSRHFWRTPIKFFHVAARELSVLLILIETLVLLGGYLMILGVHHSIRYCLSKLRHKTFAENNVPYNNYMRNYQNQHAIPRRVPRGRMAGG